MKNLYWALLVVGVALVLAGTFGDNMKWLIIVGVAVVLVGGALTRGGRSTACASSQAAAGDVLPEW